MLRYTLTAVLVLWGSLAAAATRYVNIAVAGGDSNSCAASQTVGTPKQHFEGASGALACMAAGDTLIVKAGTYDTYFWSGESSHKIPAGTASAYTTIRAATGETVLIKPTALGAMGTAGLGMVACFGCAFGTVDAYIELDGLNMDMSYPSLPAENYAVTAYTCDSGNGANTHHVRLKNLDQILAPGYLGSPTTGVTANQLYATCAGAGNYEFTNLTIHGGGEGGATGHGFYIAASNVTIDHCTVYDVTGWGLQVYNGGGMAVTNVVIRNSTFRDITRRNGSTRSPAGIVLANESNGTQVYNNLFYNIGSPAFAGSADAAIDAFAAVNAQISHNTIYNTTNNTRGIWVQSSSSGIVLRNNIAYQTSGASYQNDAGGTTTQSNNLFGINPSFVNAGAADFHLADGSAAIDTGLTLGSITTDVEGNTRPQGPAYDIGAYEKTTSGGGPPCTPAGFSPANGATGIDLFTTLSWTCSTPAASSYDVYYGLPGDVNSPVLSDSFTGPDAVDIGTNFTAYSNTGITYAQRVANRVRSVNTSQYSVEAVVSVGLQADQWCRVQLVTLANASNNIGGCVLRGTIPGAGLNGYLVSMAGTNQTGSWIARVSNGLVDAYLATETATVWAPGDRVQATIVGSTITLTRYPSTTPILTASDATYTIGRAGLVVFSGTVGAVELDNYEAGNLGLPFIQNQVGTSFATPSQAPNTVYQYRVESRNTSGTTPGPTVSYTTLGTTATPVGVRLRFAAP